MEDFGSSNLAVDTSQNVFRFEFTPFLNQMSVSHHLNIESSV